MGNRVEDHNDDNDAHDDPEAVVVACNHRFRGDGAQHLEVATAADRGPLPALAMAPCRRAHIRIFVRAWVLGVLGCVLVNSSPLLTSTQHHGRSRCWSTIKTTGPEDFPV